MKTVKSGLVALVFSLILVFVSPVMVKAQYDSNVVQPEYRDGGEVYGIDISASESVTFFPEGCESIDKVTIEAKNPINGEIFVKTQSENPQPDAQTPSKVFEFCYVELKDINVDDINKVTVEAKVRKSWLEENGVSEGNIALFTFDAEGKVWNAESTTRKTESSIYVFYQTEASNFPNWAVAENTSSALDFLKSINPGILLLCCVILLVLLILFALTLIARRRGQQVE